MQTAPITVDASSLAWLAELRERLSRFSQLVEKPVDLVKLIHDLPKPVSRNFNLVAARGAGESRIVLKRSDCMVRLMTALLALDRDGHRVGSVGSGSGGGDC